MLYFGPNKKPSDHALAHAWGAEANGFSCAAAFASESGGRALSTLMPIGEPDGPRKRWLIGIENGFSQPEALTFLAALPNSEVRVPHGWKTLDSKALRGPLFFHPKIYVVQTETELAIVSASGNLTEGGLLKNTEQFMLWTGDHQAPEAASFNEWWAYWWDRADVADPKFIAAYDKARPKIQRPAGPGGGPPTAPVLEVEPAPSDLKQAKSMWVEATRPLEGGARNQLELMLTAHHFFYDEDNPARDVGKTLEFVDVAGNVYDNKDRIVHYNGPPFMPKGNAMWRVRLPTAHEGLAGYQAGGVAIRFSRTKVPNRYLVDMATLGSPTTANWEANSRKISSLPGPPPRRMGWT